MSLMESAVRNVEYVDYNLSKTILGYMMLYVLSDNRSIKRSHLVNMNNLLSTYNPKCYEKDQEASEMIEFIRRGLDARLEHNLTDPQLILYHIKRNISDADSVHNYETISTSTIQWLNQMVSSTLDQAYVFNDMDRMVDICTRFKTTNDLSEKAKLVEDYKEQVARSQNAFRKNKNEAEEDEMFSLEEGTFENSIRDTYNAVCNPSRKLLMGNQALNELFGGGLEEGRVYCLFGLPGEGKSMTLLNIAYMVKQYNRNVKTKDPTKKPCIVILTMENRIVESICRLFNMSIRKHTSITEYTVDDVMRLMRSTGRLELTGDNPIDIIIKFKPANSCDTSYMYSLLEDLEDMGKECILLVQDYVAKIRSTERYADTRLEFGAVVDDFKNLAALKKIPVLTASQLNRDASKHIDEGRKNNKADLVRLLGRSNISESMLILNNVDGGFVVAPETTPSGETYMGIQRIKKRFEASDQGFYYIPYHPGTMTMKEDIGLAPISKTTLKEDPYGGADYANTMVAKYNMNRIEEVDSYFESNGDEIQFAGTIYGNDPDISSDTAAMSKNYMMYHTAISRTPFVNSNGYKVPIVIAPIMIQE